jgi:hypothetical protein
MGLKAVATLVPGGGAPVGGSGTPGTLPIWTAPSTLGNSAIVQVAGAIATVTLTAGGAGYTNGTYSQQALTGGTGTGATANIVVAGGIVTVLVLMNPGTGYAVGNTLSCGTIGAGAGFVLTVATIAQIVAGSGNVTALGRIGAGTTNPIAGLDIADAASINGFSRFFPVSTISPSTGVISYSSSSQILAIGTRSADYDLSSVGTGFFYPINISPVITNLSGNFQAIQCRPILKSTSGTAQAHGCLSLVLRTAASDLATISHIGFNAQFTLSTGASAAASYSQSTVRGAVALLTFNAPGTTTEATGFRANIAGNSTHAITTSQGFWQEAATFSGGTTVANFYGFRLGVQTVTAPSTITNAYGLRLEAFAGTGTITNRWGISQEDALASNVLAGKTAMGQAAATVATAQADLGASTTAAASLRIRSGVAPTAPNDGDIWFDGTNIFMRVGGVTKTFTLV